MAMEVAAVLILAKHAPWTRKIRANVPDAIAVAVAVADNRFSCAYARTTSKNSKRAQYGRLH